LSSNIWGQIEAADCFKCAQNTEEEGEGIITSKGKGGRKGKKNANNLGSYKNERGGGVFPVDKVVKHETNPLSKKTIG